VEHSDSLTLLEAPVSPERSVRIEQYLAERFPNKPVKQVLATHHHYDHVSGLRHWVAKGATIITSDLNKEYLEQLFARPSTIIPDAQAGANKSANFIVVPANGEIEIGDEERPITVYGINVRQSADMLLPYLPNEKITLVADVYSPPFPPVSSTEALE